MNTSVRAFQSLFHKSSGTSKVANCRILWYAVALLLLLQATSSFAQSLDWVNQPLTAVGGADEGRAIARDASGNVYVTGYFSGTADFDPDPGTRLRT